MRHQEKGATLVEYALLIALVVVVCIGVIEVLTDNSDEKVDTRSGEIGVPSEENALPGATDGSGGGTSTDGSDGGGSVSAVAHVGGLSAATSTSSNGNKWSATVTVTIVDASGEPVTGATVTGDWSAGNGGTSCVTGASGTCPISSADFNAGGGNPVESVTFSVTNVSGSSVASYDSAANTSSSIVISRP
jgi:hypothetical protein